MIALTVPATNVSTRAAWAKIALACAIVAATLWDFRIHNLRVFDLAAFVFFVAFFALDFDVGRGWFRRRAYILPIVALVTVYAVVGYLNFHHRSSLAIIFLAAVGLQFAGYRDILWTGQVFRWVIYVNVAALLVQFLSYRLFGVLLDPQQLFDGGSRLFAAGSLRPAGLFQEPNSYSLNMLVVASVALLPKRDRVLALVAAGSMLMSESLWGIVGAFVLVALNEWNASETLVKKTATTLALWAAIFVGFNAYLWLAKPAEVNVPVLYGRILEIAGDTSARDRYGAIIDQTPQSHVGQAVRSSPAVVPAGVVKWLGHGLSTSVFLDAVSANGLSFLWYCLGPVGLVLLIGASGLALSGLTLQDKLYIAAAVAFAFTTYPLMTYAIFWIWLPGLIMVARQRSREPRIVVSQPCAAGG